MHQRGGQELVLVASADGQFAEAIAERLRRAGAVAYAARSEAGCLRVATAVGPDVVLLDSNLSPRLERLLRAHPVSRDATIVRLPEAVASDGSYTATAWSRRIAS
jgi:CheY-like chemotaxis protein